MKTLKSLAFKATGIGSMPFADINKALELGVKAFPDIMVWPQLPHLGHNEDMTFQFSEGFPGLIFDQSEERYYVDSSSDEFYLALEEFMLDFDEIIEGNNVEKLEKYAITEEYSHAFRPWLDKATQLQPLALKGQIIGPFTYSTMLTDKEKKCIYYDGTVRETMEKFLALKALWQINQFKKACPDSEYIISLDEPSMSQYGSSAFLTVSKNDIVASIDSVAEIIHKAGALSFIHCCGNTDWTIVTSSSVNILNFDAYTFSDSITLYPDEIKSFIDRGGMLAWGLIPTLDPDEMEKVNLDIIVGIFENARNNLVRKGVNEDKLLSQSIITPACGMGSLSETLALKALNLTHEVANELRSRYIK